MPSDLPRGLSDRNPGAHLATARWATTEELQAHVYRPGDIFLGTIPAPSKAAQAAIAELTGLRRFLDEDTAIDPAWKAAQSAIANRHIALLSETSLLAIGTRDDRHMLTAAGTRSGKGTSAIVPNLCLYPGAAIVIDPKGENARLTAARRGADGMGQEIAVLDPYNSSGLPAASQTSWNPMDILKLDDPEVVDKASSITDAMMIRGKGSDAHFDESAHAFIKGLILFVVILNDMGVEDAPPRNLLSVYDYLMRGAYEDLDAERDNPEPSDAFMLLLFQMNQIQQLDGLVSAAASALMSIGERERGSVLSTARRNLAFLERPRIRRALATSSFDLDRIKTAREGMTLYLCLPQQRMSDCGRWLRLMITATLDRAYSIEAPPATGHPILFLLEEFASLGHMEAIETAAGYAAGFGVKLWVIVQDLNQLRRHYQEGWETFVGNAGVFQAFGNSDTTTLEYLSKKLGEVEVTQSVQSVTTSLSASSNDPSSEHRMQSLLQNRGAFTLLNPVSLLLDEGGTGQSATTTSSTNEQIVRSPLMLSDEIERFFRRESRKQLVSLKGLPPLILDRANYYDSPLFADFFNTTTPQDEDIDRIKALAKEATEFARSVRDAVQQAKRRK